MKHPFLTLLALMTLAACTPNRPAEVRLPAVAAPADRMPANRATAQPPAIRATAQLPQDQEAHDAH